MEKALLESINYMSLRIEEYLDKTSEHLAKENKNGLALINLQKAYLINDCMRNMVGNFDTESKSIYNTVKKTKNLQMVNTNPFR